MKNFSMHFCFGTALVLGLLPGLTFAQSMGDKMGGMMNGTMKRMDDRFAMKAAHGGATEVALGKLAAEKASDPDVKAFGQKMVDDHTKANDQLMAVAKEENMSLPTDMDAKQQAMYNKLSGMSGAAFDKAYVADMVKDHQEDVAEFQKEANTGKDPQIKSFAAQTLPVIQGHLSSIQSIQSKMMSGSKTSM